MTLAASTSALALQDPAWRVRFRRFAWTTLGLTLLVIVWGAYVRASGSGAGCGAHWPTCDGEILPRPKTVEMLVELTHRYSSGVLGLGVVAEVLAAFLVFPRKHPVRAAALAALVLMLTEGAIGAALVLLEHVHLDTSAGRAIWVSLHLCNTFLLVGALTATAHFSMGDPERVRISGARGERETRALVAIGGVALMLVGVTGAVTALGDTLFRAETLARGIADDFSPAAHFLQQLRVAHPLVAVGASVFVLYARGPIAAGRGRDAAFFSRLVAGIIVAQLLLGVANFALQAPVATQLFHLLLADLVWIAFVRFGASALTAPRGD